MYAVMFNSRWGEVHKIILILKGSDPWEVQNYRPISLLCILSKVLESIIYIKMVDFTRPLISKYQFSFLSNRSCLSQFLSSFSYTVNSIESKKPVMLFFWTLDKPLILSHIQNYSLNCGLMASLVLYGPGFKRTYPIAHTTYLWKDAHPTPSQLNRVFSKAVSSAHYCS